jgi:hypothetical protein
LCLGFDLQEYLDVKGVVSEREAQVVMKGLAKALE